MSNNQPVYWKMRNGRLISVDEMDINHLRNVLKMIIRNSQKHKTPVQIANKTPFEIGSTGWIEAKQKAQFELNGDIAQSFNDDNYSDLDDIQWSDGEFYKQ